MRLRIGETYAASNWLEVNKYEESKINSNSRFPSGSHAGGAGAGRHPVTRKCSSRHFELCGRGGFTRFSAAQFKIGWFAHLGGRPVDYDRKREGGGAAHARHFLAGWKQQLSQDDFTQPYQHRNRG